MHRLTSLCVRFGGGYPVLIAYECGVARNCAGALDPLALEMAHQVSRSLEQSPFVRLI